MIVGCFAAYFNMHWVGIFVDSLEILSLLALEKS